jgi:hypothetical protein
MPDRLSDVINIKDWGALGDNSHNDAPNIQAAIDYCASHGGGTIYFPSGTYKCNSTLEVGSAQDVGIILRGASRESTSVQSFISKGSRTFDNIERAESITFNGLRLTRPNASAISVHSNIEASECENVTIAGCMFRGGTSRPANAGYGYPTNPPTVIACSIGNAGTVYSSRVVNSGGIGYAVSGSGAALLSTSSENQDAGVRIGWGVRRVVGTSNNGSGAIRLQLASNLDLVDGATYYVNGVTGAAENSSWAIDVINDGVSVDLVGSTFTSPSSGGRLTGEIPAYGCTLSGHQCERCDAGIELYNAHGCYVAANREVGNDGTTSPHGPIQTMAYVATPTPHILVTTVSNHNIPAGNHVLQIYGASPTSFYPSYSYPDTAGLVNATSPGPNSNRFTYATDRDPGVAFQSSQGWNWPLRFGLRIRKVTESYVGNNYLLARAAWAMVDMNYGGEAQNNASNIMVGTTEQGRAPWLMPTHSSRPLGGWQFMTCSGRALPSQLGPNTVDSPYQMVLADLPGQTGVYQPGPFEGQEYDIVDGQKSPGVGAVWGEQVIGGGAGKYRVRYGGSPLAWRRIG